jgi:hypothetical protein
MRIDPPYRDHMEQWLREHHDEQLRERYAEVAFEFFLEKYFDKNFERFAYEAEMEIPECICYLAWIMADQMVTAKK